MTERVWVDDSLKIVLDELWNFFNELSLEKTKRPIPSGWTITSQIAAEMLKKELDNLKKSKMDVKKKGRYTREIKILLIKRLGNKKNNIIFE
jgi:hypothetical protein